MGYQHSKVSSFTKWKKKSEFDALEAMAANMNKHETFSGVLSVMHVWWEKFLSLPPLKITANNLTFSEDEDEETNIYDSQGNIM